MNILVFTKRVASFEEEEIRIVNEGKDIDLSKAPFKINDWDNYAVEEGVRIIEKSGGSLTAISMGDEESDEVLRRSIAMGANDGILIKAENMIDPFQRAVLARSLIEKENIPYDLILTGVQAEDDQFAAFGGILAGLLKLPYVTMVMGIDEIEKDKMIVRKEIEGGVQERIKVSVPCVLSIQSGINEPRYVSIMGIRKASKVERKVIEGKDLLPGFDKRIILEKYSYPPKKQGAKLIQGDTTETCRTIISILKERGVL